MNIQISEVARAWKNKDQYDRVEIIVNALEDCSVAEGGLYLRYFKKDRSLHGYIQTKPDNHLMTEVVSQATLGTLFADDFEFGDDEDQLEEYAGRILKWMDAQS
jgi:hypothetical protein